MPTKKCLANHPEIVLPDHLGAPGEGLLDLRRECRGPICNTKRPTPAGYVTSRPVKNREAIQQWDDRHDCCQVCGIDESKARWVHITGLQTHHIIKAGRSDEPCNLLRACERCHRIIEGESVPDEKGGHWPPLTLAHVLHCKREHDPQQYDPDRLTVLWRNRQRTLDFDPLPRPEPLPEMYLAERMQWLNDRSLIPWEMPAAGGRRPQTIAFHSAARRSRFT